MFSSALLLTKPLPKATDTDRVCREAGCGSAATEIDGRYFHHDRMVRVWTCPEHFSGNPLREVEVPEMVLEAADLLHDYYQSQKKRYTRDVAPERSVSVKAFGSGGFGEPIAPPSRFLSWRWGEQPGDVDNPVPLPVDPRTAMILRCKAREDAMKRVLA